MILEFLSISTAINRKPSYAICEVKMRSFSRSEDEDSHGVGRELIEASKEQV